MTVKEMYDYRVKVVNEAIALKEPDHVPVAPMLSCVPYFLFGSSFKESMYEYEKAEDSVVRFFERYHPDAHNFNPHRSGLANELAGSNMIDWPGKPGTMVDDTSTYQVIEHEYMEQDEYDEMLSDFTGYMLRKYIPRAFPKLAPLAKFKLNPASILGTKFLASIGTPELMEAYELLGKIGAEERRADESNARLSRKLAEMGFPGFKNGFGEAPFDIISDYFRGTMGTFEDLLECPEDIERACDFFADIQIDSWQYFKGKEMPYKRVYFPLHKGMDGFMSPDQFRDLYWKPLKKLIYALIDLGVTPVLYGEGPYDSRIEQLTDIPVGKCVLHLEKADMAKAKKILGDKVCLTGNLSIYLLEHGTKEQVIDETKKLLDICAPGGGYIFDTNACMGDAKLENVDAMFETLDVYGKYR